MKYSVRLLLALIILSSTTIYSTIPYFSIRSQSANAARHLAGMTGHMYEKDPEKAYATFSVRPSFAKTFDENIITKSFFGQFLNCDCGKPGLTISGSAVANRGENDLLADYFYLPRDFKSSVTFTPSIKNFLVEFGMYAGLDDWFKGMYFMINMPLVHTRWALHLKENILSRGVLPYPIGYFASKEVPRTDLLNDFKEYANGNSNSPIEDQFTATVGPTAIDQLYTVVLQQLKYAKMSCEELTRTRLADIRARLGIVILNTNNYHFGMDIQTAAPTGNRPKGIYLFEPIVGNGHHWELGMGVHGHYAFWQSESDDRGVALYIDGNITHLFESAQRRTFDLTNRPLSRYMLAEYIDTPVNFNLKGAGVTPTAQFKNEFAPVANLTNTKVKVGVGVQIDAVAMLNIYYKNFDFDFGYNVWFRSSEHVRLREQSFLETNQEEWALKGDARVYGFANADDVSVTPTIPTIAINEPIPLSATQSSATIHAGLNGTSTINASIDDAQLATAGDSNTALNNMPGGVQINTSRNPIFLKPLDINVCDSGTSGLTSKVFVHLNHTWDNRINWLPSMGIGWEMEFDQSKNICNPCEFPRCAISQWAFWINIDMSFE